MAESPSLNPVDGDMTMSDGHSDTDEPTVTASSDDKHQEGVTEQPHGVVSHVHEDEVDMHAQNGSKQSVSNTASRADEVPNQTLYINNLNDKIKLPEIKQGLYHVLGAYGNIVELMASKSFARRGQAWVVFDNLASASRALRETQGFLFFGKPMRVQYAKAKSDVVSKADHTFVPRPKRKTDGDQTKEGTQIREQRERKKQRSIENETAASIATGASAGTSIPSVPPPPPQPVEVIIPHNILFIENLPDKANELMLGMLFQQYDGYKEARMVPNKPGIAFVEFENEIMAGIAREALHGFKITSQHHMRVSFAKK